MKKLFYILLLSVTLFGVEFRVATYNVENLFDLEKSGTEYTEYIPFTGYGWNEKNYRRKLENISKVICDLKPDIIALQEIESAKALDALKRSVAECGIELPYSAIADEKPTTVKNALLSRFPILQKREIDPDGTLRIRNILEVKLDIEGSELTLFVNHWKSRSGPESMRIVSAEALMKRLENFKGEYILLGDFNSNWNEWRVIGRSKRLNDTGGVTGIGDILKTSRSKKAVTKKEIEPPYHTNLWLELPSGLRWSHNFFGRKSALDHIILPASMFDKHGINYVDRSFGSFKPSYLFSSNGAVYRWQKAKRGYGKHLGRGFSDHLPIYAEFTTGPFEFRKKSADKEYEAESGSAPASVSVAKLYEMVPGPCNLLLENVAVIYKKGPFAIIKREDDRAFLIYKDVEELVPGMRYDIVVKRLYRYRGLPEITRIDIAKVRTNTDIDPFFIFHPSRIDLKEHLNEVIGEIEGIYRRGYLYYGRGKKIKLYYRDRSKRPENGAKIVLKNVRVGIYKNRAELVID